MWKAYNFILRNFSRKDPKMAALTLHTHIVERMINNKPLKVAMHVHEKENESGTYLVALHEEMHPHKGTNAAN